MERRGASVANERVSRARRSTRHRRAIPDRRVRRPSAAERARVRCRRTIDAHARIVTFRRFNVKRVGFVRGGRIKKRVRAVSTRFENTTESICARAPGPLNPPRTGETRRRAGKNAENSVSDTVDGILRSGVGVTAGRKRHERNTHTHTHTPYARLSSVRIYLSRADVGGRCVSFSRN